MKAKRLIMDTDYHDLCWIDQGEPSDLEQLFDHLAQSGFDATIWDVHFTGTALYHAQRLPRFQNRMGLKTARKLAENLRRFDPLALAIKLGRERRIQVLAYFRLMEEAYAPFDGHEFFQKNPHYWWQTRCGMYRMVGWPCYNYPEVREHMLQRLDELVAHGVDGVVFDPCRSHIPFFVPYNFADYDFGFNPPVVEEYRRRHGVDLARFDYVEEHGSVNIAGVPFTNERRWVGAEPLDRWAFIRILGEGIDRFVREARRRHPHIHIALLGGWAVAGATKAEVAVEKFKPLPFRLDLEGLCAERAIDEYINTFDYRRAQEEIERWNLPAAGQWPEGDFTPLLLPRFQHVVDHGRQLTAWLNDIFSPTGGGDERATATEVGAYVDRFLASGVDSAVIHEACFLLQTKEPARVWHELARLKTQTCNPEGRCK